ncbi:hypothetical protein L7F22_031087 [Adiantum nelumboides]|nr:hypothetical protein [Adiantum nelumboides]
MSGISTRITSLSGEDSFSTYLVAFPATNLLNNVISILAEESKGWDTGDFVHLPGPPDNVRANEAGDFWVAIHCRQTLFVWAAFAIPWTRHALLKLPLSLKTIYGFFLGGTPHALIMRYDSGGNVQEVLEDQTGKLVKLVSEVEERDGELWLGSELMPYVAVYSR